MTSRTIFRGIFWTLIGLALVFHVAGGWFFSNELIDDAFVPDPDSYVVASGDYELEEIKYQSPLGEMDAWYLPAEGTTTMIRITPSCESVSREATTRAPARGSKDPNNLSRGQSK